MKVLACTLARGRKRNRHFPSLGLAKLSTWYKARGHEVRLTDARLVNRGWVPDVLLFSAVFTFNRASDLALVNALAGIFPAAAIRIGGPAVTLDPAAYRDPLRHLGDRLSVEPGIDPQLDALVPDWSLDPSAFSYGFTSRGCLRACPWCIVPRIEGPLRRDPDWRRYLGPHPVFAAMDNNALALGVEHVREVLEELKARRKRIDWNQGVDVRIMTSSPEWTELLKAYAAQIEYIRPAWDSRAVDKPARAAIDVLAKAGIPGRRVRWLILYGYKDTLADLHARMTTVLAAGHYAKPMRYIDLDTGEAAGGWAQRFSQWVSLVTPTGAIGPLGEEDDSALWGRTPEELYRLLELVGTREVKRAVNTFGKVDRDFLRQIARTGRLELRKAVSGPS
jgi:hypothetical protein